MEKKEGGMISFLGCAFAVAFFVGGNLYFYFRFFDPPRAKGIEEDFSELGEDPK